MSEDNSTKAITGAQSGGLNIIVVALLLLLAVVLGWYIGQSGAKPRDINFLPPASGVLDYYLSVNEEAQPTPYAPTAEAFTPCVENCFEELLMQEDLDTINKIFAGKKAYIVWEEGDQGAADQKQSNVSLFEQAHAAASGCYVVKVYRVGGSAVVIYNKPGCP